MPGPKNILLVDDQQHFLVALANALKECSNTYSILTAENGDSALKALESGRVDLVVTDLRMPVMDGFGLISNMKKKYPGIPVIVLSSYSCPELKPRLKAMGVSQYIEKSSLDISALEQMIQEIWPGPQF